MVQTLTQYLEDIFGTYEPCITYDANNIPIDTSINFGYIASVVVFLVCLYFVLKTIGGIIYEFARK